MLFSHQGLVQAETGVCLSKQLLYIFLQLTLPIHYDDDDDDDDEDDDYDDDDDLEDTDDDDE